MTRVSLDSLVHRKERLYFAVIVIVSLLVYAGLGLALFGGAAASAAGTVALVYAGAISLAVFMLHSIALGSVRGNAVKVSATQFPDVFELAKRHGATLQLDAVPDVFILQSGGVLNAFAARLMRRHFVVINSDVLALAEVRGIDAVSFIVAHELAHVKRGHLDWRWLTLPGRMVPYLGSAWSRACEYTCDRFGMHCEPAGAVSGLLVLAAGRDLYYRVNAREYAAQAATEKGFWVRRAELLASHPHLPKRLAALLDAGAQVPVEAPASPIRLGDLYPATV